MKIKTMSFSHLPLVERKDCSAVKGAIKQSKASSSAAPKAQPVKQSQSEEEEDFDSDASETSFKEARSATPEPTESTSAASQAPQTPSASLLKQFATPAIRLLLLVLSSVSSFTRWFSTTLSLMLAVKRSVPSTNHSPVSSAQTEVERVTSSTRSSSSSVGELRRCVKANSANLFTTLPAKRTAPV